MNKHKSNKIKENSNTVRHLIMGQIITTQNLVAIKVVRHAGQWNIIVYIFSMPWVGNNIVTTFNTLKPRQDGRHFPDDIFICIFLNKNEWHSIKISLKFVPRVAINNFPALVQTMAWRRPGDKPLSEPMMVVLPTHICVTRPQWVQGTLMMIHFNICHVCLKIISFQFMVNSLLEMFLSRL